MYRKVEMAMGYDGEDIARRTNRRGGPSCGNGGHAMETAVSPLLGGRATSR